MSSPNDTIMPSNNISHVNVDIVPEHMLRWIFTLMVFYCFPLLRSCMNSFRVLIGHCRRLEEPVARDPEAPTTEEVERLEAGISINKKFFFVSNFLSSAASGGIFAFLQISKGKAKPTMKHIYIACNVCFATSIVVVVADSFLAIIAFNMGS
ncbi:uncharacterized protein LOC122090081 [Macadamia integrifolia]|uniref:uncharacterized protein LOC122090081 n=1 Tax=Macadamia integrifolia TaxID=60698 RepID=UPI001C4F1239|nr:uncharacterized protein LOC122090081 [Macadamia integrifolia]